MGQESAQSELRVPCPHCGGSGQIPLTKHPEWRRLASLPELRSDPYRWRRLLSGIVSVTLVVGIAIAYVSQPTSERERDPDDWSHFPDAEPAEAPQFVGVEQPLPASGEAWFCESGRSGCWRLEQWNRSRTVPFRINTQFGQHYLLKLALPSKNHLLIFVRGGSPVAVDVPLGTYTLTYAVGTRWYGHRSDKKFFGAGTEHFRADDTFAFSADMEWVSVTLYPVPRGNLRTREISADEF